MKEEEFIKGLKYLGIAYNKEFTKDQATVWYEFFKDTSYDTFRQAIKRLIPKEQFMPSIAVLKKEIAYINTPTLQLDAEEEWYKAYKEIHKYGRYQVAELMKSLPPEIADILRRIGIEKIFNSEDITWERKQFIEIFNNQKKDVERLNLLSNSVLTEYEIDKKLEEKYLIGE